MDKNPVLFENDFEQEAIERVQKFARIAKAMDLAISVGFSGGKDSQVVYDLCQRAGIEFTAYFNHSLESAITLRFIKEHYPAVVWRRDVKHGLIEVIRQKEGFLPTPQSAYCCELYKHNPRYADACAILGIRRAESVKRSKRTAFVTKNKTTLKRIKASVDEYFKEQCQSVGSSNILTLNPIVDWSEADVWRYIEKYQLPVNPEYLDGCKRVGCIVCCKAGFAHNYRVLIRYPKLIDAFINARTHAKDDWRINSDDKDYSDNKPYYICRWLNHGFAKFTKKHEEYYKQVMQAYETRRR